VTSTAPSLPKYLMKVGSIFVLVESGKSYSSTNLSTWQTSTVTGIIDQSQYYIVTGSTPQINMLGGWATSDGINWATGCDTGSPVGVQGTDGIFIRIFMGFWKGSLVV
jgi:hypothetical protein